MTRHGEKLTPMKALIIDDELHSPTATGRAAQALIKELQNRDVEIIEAITEDDAESIVRTDPSVQCIILDWEIKGDESRNRDGEKNFLKMVREL